MNRYTEMDHETGKVVLIRNAEQLCDGDCNHCPLIRGDNSRMLTALFNELVSFFGDDCAEMVRSFCTNLTVCKDCRVDDFTHVESCFFGESGNVFSDLTTEMFSAKKDGRTHFYDSCKDRLPKDVLEALEVAAEIIEDECCSEEAMEILEKINAVLADRG